MNISDYLRESAELVGDEDGAYLIEIEASPMHHAVVRMLRRMLETMGELAAASGKMNPGLKTALGGMARTLRVLEPTLLEGFVDVPPDQIEAFLHALSQEFQHAIDEAHGATRARQDQPPAA